MNDFLKFVLNVHGGLEKWQQYESVTAHLTQGGALWGLKGKAGLLDDVNVTVGTKQQFASHTPFGASDVRSYFERNRIALEKTDGTVIAEDLTPRRSFEGHTLQTPWSELQLAFFAGCAMWTYLNVPFLLVWPGVEVIEVDPWSEQGETWRRFAVTYPQTLEVFSRNQTVYFGEDGLLRRMDYDVEIAGNTPGAHYVSEYKEFGGILFPTKREIFPRKPDGTSLTEPLVVSIALDNIVLR